MGQYSFCSMCGSKLVMKVCENDSKERPCCPSCSFVQYHNPKPTVKAVIFKDHKMLMVRRAEEPRLGGWDLPGGYLEWNEHPEEGTTREVWEEAGVESEVTHLIGVFHKVWRPGYEDSSILNICYLCEWVSGEPKVMSSEIDRAQWVDLDDLPGWIAYGHYDEVLKILGR